MLIRRNKKIENPDSIILQSDSYKYSQFAQYPPGTQMVRSYSESRGGKWKQTVVFGPQAFVMKYLTNPITLKDIDEAEELITAHGEPFNRKGWEYILNVYDGKLPVTIKAIPEGTILSTKNVINYIKNNGGAHTLWLTNFLETALLRATWYGTTVATNSFESKKVIYEGLKETGTVADLPYKLVDFGARGVSSHESAGYGGAAHLVNFAVSDNIEGLVHARNFYDANIAGSSIPAMEHSTVTSWGRDGEEDSFRNMITQYALNNGLVKKSALIACVSDSYDIYEACKLWGTKLKQDVLDSGSIIVIRPDSGYPPEVVTSCLRILEKYFGSVRNNKGYKVLNNVRVIQGDGIDTDMIRSILNTADVAGFSADNITFGQGGALLQGITRDTQEFAMKCSAIMINDQWIDVYKDPSTDPTKASKRGLVTLFSDTNGSVLGNQFHSDIVNNAHKYDQEALVTIFENGETMNELYWEDVVKNANKYFVNE